MDPLTTDQSTAALHTAVILVTLSLEKTQGFVFMTGPGVDQLQCVSVSGIEYGLYNHECIVIK